MRYGQRGDGPRGCDLTQWQGPALTHILLRFSSYARILVTSQSPEVMDCMLSLLLLGCNTEGPA